MKKLCILLTLFSSIAIAAPKTGPTPIGEAEGTPKVIMVKGSEQISPAKIAAPSKKKIKKKHKSKHRKHKKKSKNIRNKQKQKN